MMDNDHLLGQFSGRKARTSRDNDRSFGQFSVDSEDLPLRASLIGARNSLSARKKQS